MRLRARGSVAELASRAQLRMSFLRIALVAVPAVLLLGTLAGNLAGSDGGDPWYASLERPSFEPPGWAFPVAWTILYICLGLSLAMLIHARGARGQRPLIALFIVQLLVNFSWSPVFFGLHRIGLALAIIGAMIALTVILIAGLWRVRRAAAWLLVPYLAWLCLAAALNYRIVVDNPEASRVAPDSVRTDIPIE